MTSSARWLAAALAGLPLATLAQQGGPLDLSGFWAVRIETERSGRALLDELSPDVVMIEDTGGGELAAGDFAGLALSAAARAELRAYDYASELRPERACVRPSAAFFMQAPFPMEIHQSPEMIVFQMEYFDMYRIVFMDGRGHLPPDAPHTKSGHSIGRWDGETLVVDTTHLLSATFMNNGFSHSDDLHMVERFRLSPDGQILWLVQTYEDPAVFAGTAGRYMAWTSRPGQHVYPYDCDPGYSN